MVDLCTDMLDEAIACVLNQVKHIVEAFRITVVGVGHHRLVVLKAKLGESAYLGLVLHWTSILYQRKVIPVHDENQVVAHKVLIRNLACPQVGQVISAPGSMGLCSFVGGAFGVVVVGSGGINRHLMRQALVHHFVPEYAMRSGAAANIAHANKKDRVAGFHGLHFYNGSR